MQTRFVLTDFFVIAEQKGHPFWNLDFDLSSVDFCERLSEYFESELILFQDNTRAQAITYACVHDIIQYKTTQEGQITIANFLQFMLCSHLAYHFVTHKMQGYAFDWIANAIDEEVGKHIERNVTPDCIRSFIISDHPFIRRELANVLGYWVYALFYYSWTTGGHVPLAKEFLRAFGTFYLSLPAYCKVFDEYFLSLCQILTWSIENRESKLAGEVAQTIRKVVNDQVPAHLKMNLILQLSCIDEDLSGQPQEVWAGMLLEQYSQLLVGHQRMQLWVNFTNNSAQKILQNIGALVDAITEYHQAIEQSEADQTMIMYELVQIYATLYPVLVVLLKEGHSSEAERIFTHYFKIERPVEGSILHIIPNDRQGIIYSLAEQVKIIRSKHEEPMFAITVCMNRFLQLTNILKGKPDYQPEAVEKKDLGTPNEAEAPSLLLALQDHFQFDLLQQIIRDGAGYYLHNGINYPLQPVMLSQTGQVLPMSLSFQQPEPARKVRKVLIWQGDSFTSVRECEGLVNIFEKAGVEFTLLLYDQHNADDFLLAFEATDYDAVIVSGHGVYEHYEPHASYIHLSETQHLNREAINGLNPQWEHRRLLLLNVCDGAATALHNSPLSIGMATQLVHSRQSLFSHFWPVNPRVACLFSWLVAAKLTTTNEYSTIYRDTVWAIRNGRDEVSSQLAGYMDEEFIETVNNIDIDLSNFTHWGSLVYFE